VASAHHEGTVYVTLEGHRSNDFRPYVLKSTDYGRTFRSIAAGLPDDASVYVIREHHRNPQLLVVGTEYGVFATINGGQAWTQLAGGLPPAPVHDVIIHPVANDLIVGTHGRGIWILDDLTPLEQLARAAPAVAHLFQPQPATIQNTHGGLRLFGNRNYTTTNPRTRNLPGSEHSGASFAVFTGSAAPAGATAAIAITDASGAMVREIPVALRPGLQRVDWDLRWSQPLLGAPPAPQRRADEEEEGAAPPRPAPGGPYVFPGTYNARLVIRDASGATRTASETTVTVRQDPALTLSDAEYRQLHAARMEARGTLLEIAGLVEQLAGARDRLQDAVAQRDTAAPDARPAAQLIAEVDVLLATLRGPARPAGAQAGGGVGGVGAPAPALFGRVQGVASAIGTTHFMPTPAQDQALEEARRELQGVAAQVPGLLSRVGPALQALASELAAAGR
jgi:hypothetical protein